jgi:hypothetical protein
MQTRWKTFSQEQDIFSHQIPTNGNRRKPNFSQHNFKTLLKDVNSKSSLMSSKHFLGSLFLPPEEGGRKKRSQERKRRKRVISRDDSNARI